MQIELTPFERVALRVAISNRIGDLEKALADKKLQLLPSTVRRSWSEQITALRSTLDKLR
jgi:hypothetical protein